MSFNHQLQRNRFELKFIINEETARHIRDFARAHLERDDHAIPELHYAYPIYSLYLDSPGLTLYRATVEGQMNRYKIRIRYYDENPWSPVFFEIKRRVNEVILKERAIVRRERMPELLQGRCPRPDDMTRPDDFEGYSALRRFIELKNALHADGKVIVYYHREAWVTAADDNVRLTFDRELRTARYDGSLENRRWLKVPMEGVVLELKFDTRFPTWMRELVRECDLYRTSFPKYVHCTSAASRSLQSLSHL